jgi:hypothetical protein
MYSRLDLSNINPVQHPEQQSVMLGKSLDDNDEDSSFSNEESSGDKLTEQRDPRRIGAVQSGKQKVGQGSIKRAKIDEGVVFPLPIANCELDSHADTCCVGENFRLVELTGQQCEVKGFHDTLDVISDVPIATVATKYINPITTEAYILIVYECLYFGSTMGHSLINPNQLQAYGVTVNDNPYNRNNPLGIVLDDGDHVPF